MLRVLFGFAVLVLSSAVSAQPWDGPFGLKMGLTKAQIESALGPINHLSADLYSLNSISKHYPGIKVYGVTISPTVGLCRITTMMTVESPGNGDKVKRKFERIKNDLIEKYGQPAGEFDFIDHDSLWTEPQDWMMSFADGDRHLLSIWTKEKAEKDKLKIFNEIHGITLQVEGKSSNSASIFLGYEFSNVHSCIAEQKERNADAL